MANPELGQKQICPNCQAKFYDLNRRPAHCPKCAAEFDPEEAVKSRRIRARSVTPNYDEDTEDQVKGTAADADEEADEPATPEIDEAVEEDILVEEDEEAGDKVAAPADDAGIEIEDDVEVEDDDAVPFLEEEEDETFDDEIEGIPEPDEER